MIMCCQRKQSAFMYESDKQIVRFYSLFKKQVFLIYAFIRLKKAESSYYGMQLFHYSIILLLYLQSYFSKLHRYHIPEP